MFEEVDADGSGAGFVGGGALVVLLLELTSLKGVARVLAVGRVGLVADLAVGCACFALVDAVVSGFEETFLPV